MQRTVAAAVAVVATPWLANAEPTVLTASEMDAVTAAALVEVHLPINLSLPIHLSTGAIPIDVVPGGVRLQTNITTQVANALALAFVTCGICIGGGPSAISAASAINTNAAAQSQH